MEKVRMAVIGLGNRGYWWLEQLLAMEDVDVTAVCDLKEDRLQRGVKAVEEKYGHAPFASVSYKEVVCRKDLDAVFVTTYWNDHIKVSIAAMKAGKYTACEVGPAQSIQQCWDLVAAYEETGIPMMMMENCCYGRQEMTILNMIKKGLFGEVVHVGGGYRHDLRNTLVNGFTTRDHERCWQNWHRNADLYPTHELGPMMTYLDINHGNRMLTLTAMAAKGRGLSAFAQKTGAVDREFREGDVVKTLIKCANGETIELTHDTTLPHPYSRMGIVEGTNGLCMETGFQDEYQIYVEGRSPEEQWEKMEDYYGEFEHPLWKKTGAAGFEGGHGGMDWLVMRAFVEAVRNHTDVPIDVYDAAAMMAVGILSEDSIALGSAPVAIPDFTNGLWVRRPKGPSSIYSLYDLEEELFENEAPVHPT